MLSSDTHTIHQRNTTVEQASETTPPFSVVLYIYLSI